MEIDWFDLVLRDHEFVILCVFILTVMVVLRRLPHTIPIQVQYEKTTVVYEFLSIFHHVRCCDLFHISFNVKFSC